MKEDLKLHLMIILMITKQRKEILFLTKKILVLLTKSQWVSETFCIWNAIFFFVNQFFLLNLDDHFECLSITRYFDADCTNLIVYFLLRTCFYIIFCFKCIRSRNDIKRNLTLSKGLFPSLLDYLKCYQQ